MNDVATAPLDSFSRLRRSVISFSNEGYAVIDGGLFDDMPALLKRIGLFGRSLFLDQVDIEIQKAGPWLVSLGQAPSAVDRIFELTDKKPAAVFWYCNAGEKVLHRHLRTLNMASIPTWAATGKEERDAQIETYTLVFFRHFDPRVLGAILPTFNAKQLGRFIGPAKEVAFFSREYGYKRVLDEHVNPNFPSGSLVISSDQIDSLSARRTRASYEKISLYLREYAVDSTKNLSDEQLMQAVSSYAVQAKSLGIRRESTVGIWAYMQMTSKHDLFNDKAIRKSLADDRSGPDVDARLRAQLLARSEEIG